MGARSFGPDAVRDPLSICLRIVAAERAAGHPKGANIAAKHTGKSLRPEELIRTRVLSVFLLPAAQRGTVHGIQQILRVAVVVRVH